MNNDDDDDDVKLKSCPFCNHEARYVEKNPDFAKNYWIECVNCLIQTQIYYELKDAVENWNTRVECQHKFKVIRIYGDLISNIHAIAQCVKCKVLTD